MKRAAGLVLCFCGIAGMLLPYALLMSSGDIALVVVALGSTVGGLAAFHAGVDLFTDRSEP